MENMCILSRATIKIFLNFMIMEICKFMKKWGMMNQYGKKMASILFLLMAKKSFVMVKCTESLILC